MAKIQGYIREMIVNKQFEILGLDMKFEDIPEDELIDIGKGKKRLWYNHFKFTEEQEEEWRKWYRGFNNKRLSEKELMFIELRYGFVLDYSKKKGS